MNEKKDTLKIHKISADNIYKLKHVEMELTEKGLVSIGGSNDQGKSSLFNAIRIALSGKSESGSKPIRDGEENGEITLE
jgi:predicted ATP-binding protein involved in virulence